MPPAFLRHHEPFPRFCSCDLRGCVSDKPLTLAPAPQSPLLRRAHRRESGALGRTRLLKQQSLLRTFFPPRQHGSISVRSSRARRVRREFIYRRHSPKCPHTSRDYNHCHCRIWYDWNLDGARTIKPIGTRDWQRAQQLAREMEAEGRVIDKKSPVTIQKACEDFLADAKARGLREPSLYKYRLLLNRLQTFATDKGLAFLPNFDVEMAAKFRESWTHKGTSARKKLESLRTFFRFCKDRNWIDSNPAAKLKMGKNESRLSSRLLRSKSRISWRQSRSMPSVRTLNRTRFGCVLSYLC